MQAASGYGLFFEMFYAAARELGAVFLELLLAPLRLQNVSPALCHTSAFLESLVAVSNPSQRIPIIVFEGTAPSGKALRTFKISSLR